LAVPQRGVDQELVSKDSVEEELFAGVLGLLLQHVEHVHLCLQGVDLGLRQ